MSDDAIRMTFAGREYAVEPPFTNRELHLIKQIAGVRAGEIFGAMDAGDNDVIVALAHIAVRRSQSPRPTLDELWDLPAGEIGLVLPDGDEAEDPTSAAGSSGTNGAGSPETTQPPAGAGSTATSST